MTLVSRVALADLHEDLTLYQQMLVDKSIDQKAAKKFKTSVKELTGEREKRKGCLALSIEAEN